MNKNNKVPHGDHDVQTFNEAHHPDNPKVHQGIMWCNDCEVEFIIELNNPGETPPKFTVHD